MRNGINDEQKGSLPVGNDVRDIFRKEKNILDFTPFKDDK